MVMRREAVATFAVAAALWAVLEVLLLVHHVVSNHVGLAAKLLVGRATGVSAIFMRANIVAPLYSLFAS